MSTNDNNTGGIADWRDAATYDYTRTFARDAWAWEFLRRNPAYRAAWTRSRSAAAGDRPHDAARWGLVTIHPARARCPGVLAPRPFRRCTPAHRRPGR